MFKERLKCFNYCIFKKSCIKRLSSTPITNTNLLPPLKTNSCILITQGPPIRYFNDRGKESDRGSYFTSKKTPTAGFVYPKTSLLFLAKQKNPTPAVNYIYVIVDLSWWKVQYPPKIPASLLDPRISLLAKTSDRKYSLYYYNLPIIKICEWGPWVSYNYQLNLFVYNNICVLHVCYCRFFLTNQIKFKVLTIEHLQSQDAWQMKNSFINDSIGNFLLL